MVLSLELFHHLFVDIQNHCASIEPEKIQALLESKDIEMSIAEIEKFKDAVMKKMENPDAALELSDEDLEDVAGGCLWIAIPIAIGIIAGICVADNLTGGRW